MRIEVVSILLALKLCTARFVFAPKFFAQDSAIIVDTDKALPAPLTPQRAHHAPPHYRPVQSYPVYQIIAQSSSTSTTTTTVAPALAPSSEDEFPLELLDIAQHKLGLKRLDEIPSISELGDILGTTGAAETIKYIRQLTANDQGIALIKSYLESYDFTDNTADRQQTDRKPSLLTPQLSDEEEAALPPQAPQGFFERVAAYLNIYNILPQHRAQLEAVTKSMAMQRHREHQQQQPPQLPQWLPQLLGGRNAPPFHFPVPIRRTAVASGSTVHLNTPKVFVPHMQLAKMANIPPKKLESMLQQKPKLAALAAKVSRLPETRGSNSANDAQLLAAVQRAIEQDEDLKKLLGTSETLK